MNAHYSCEIYPFSREVPGIYSYTHDTGKLRDVQTHTDINQVSLIFVVAHSVRVFDVCVFSIAFGN